jgi:branched-subunit amino acid aminotransferase/4-amino-4-deoxychorismate lyase
MNHTTMNRAFIYGDLLFETIKISGGKPVLAHAHYQRLINSAAVLKFEHHLSFDLFIETIQQKVAELNLIEARARFVLHRNAEGFYNPSDRSTAFFVEAFPMRDTKQSVKLGLYTDNYKPCNELATVKSGNALLYVMAGIWASENGYDDALLLNEHGCVCEATSSNVFVVKDDKVVTPPISEGCVDGVMRKFVIHQLQEKQYTISERLVTVEQIREADAVFLTNAISGVVKVAQFEERLYDNSAWKDFLML